MVKMADQFNHEDLRIAREALKLLLEEKAGEGY